MLIGWPLSSILGLGEWEEVEDGWTFHYDPVYGWFGTVVMLVLLAFCIWVGYLLATSSQHQVKHARYRGVAVAHTEPEIIEILKQSPPQLLLPYASDREQGWSKKGLTMFLGVILLPIGLGVGSTLAPSLGLSDRVGPLAAERLILAGICALPGLMAIGVGYYYLRMAIGVDDRMLIDFDAREIHQVDVSCSDGFKRPLIGFDAISDVALTTRVFEDNQDFAGAKIRLARVSGGDMIAILQSTSKEKSEELAEALAKSLGVNVVRDTEKIDRPNS